MGLIYIIALVDEEMHATIFQVEAESAILSVASVLRFRFLLSMLLLKKACYSSRFNVSFHRTDPKLVFKLYELLKIFVRATQLIGFCR